jgi:hypothetical protein
MSSNINLVETVRAGKQTWVIIHGPKPRFMLGEKFVRATELTPEEAKLGLEQVLELYRVERLTVQRADRK